MRFLRFVALLLVVAVAYIAQLVLHPPLFPATTDFFPPQLKALLPQLLRLRPLFLGDLRDTAFLFLAVAALTYGLVTTPWPFTAPPMTGLPATLVIPSVRRRQRLGWLAVLLAFLLAIVSSLLFRDQELGAANRLPVMALPLALPPALVALVQERSWLPEGLWLTSLVCFLIGCTSFPWRFQQEEPKLPPAALLAPAKQPTASWPLLLLILLFAGLLYGWRLTAVPLAVDEQVAQVALFASDWLRKGAAHALFLTPVELEPGMAVTGLATTVMGLFFRLTNDLLLSMRLAGLWAALLTMVATWLAGTEVFYRLPLSSPDSAEDQGQWPALLAVILVMFAIPTMIFSRLPVLLETVAWGTLGCWALLRGLRTGDRLAIGLSGVLIGLSAVLYTPGLVFVGTSLFWWTGYWFVQAGWLPHRMQAQLPGSRLRGYCLLWLVGVCVVAAPVFGMRSVVDTDWLLSLRSNLAAHWQPTLLAFGQLGDRSQLGGLAAPFLHDLLVPVWLLAIGALWFNLDRRVGWLLLTWLGCGLLGAMALGITAPNWPALLPLLPATGLILAMGLDRFRQTALVSAGPWLRNLVNYLLLGLILWVGFKNSVNYYHFVQQQADPISALGHELRRLPAGEAVTAIVPPGITADTPQLRFFTNDWLTPSRTYITFAETLPDTLPAGAVILVAPADAMVLAELQVRYPGGTVVVRRDHLLNRLLYRYTLPD